MSKPTIKFFYDVVSPYTIFAYKVLLRYETLWNLNIQLRPFFLGGIMKGAENKPPAVVPAKATYLPLDVMRCAKYYEVPLKFPTDLAELMFGNKTLTAQRFLSAVDLQKPEKLRAVTDSLIDRIWFQDKDVMSLEGVAEASKTAGISAEETADLISKVKSDAVKDHLKDITQEALDNGAFGSPTFLVDTPSGTEMIFGSDRFPVIADLLGKKWQGPNPGASSKL